MGCHSGVMAGARVRECWYRWVGRWGGVLTAQPRLALQHIHVIAEAPPSDEAGLRRQLGAGLGSILWC